MAQTAPICTRLPLLDGLRGIAALGVATFHIGSAFPDVRSFDRMYLFVDFFFMLSGFVLTLAAGPKFDSGMSARDFLRARIARLWPMVALGAVLGALFMLPDAPAGPIAYFLVLSLIMVPIITSPVAIFPLNGPQWSILWELAANYVHAAFLHRLGQRTLLALAAVSGIAFLASIMHAGHADIGALGRNWWLVVPRIAWAYVLGIWMARIWCESGPRPLASWYVALLLPLAVLLFLPSMALARPVGDAGFCLLLMPAMFWMVANASPPAWAHRGLSELGAISFPLYAVHVPVIYVFRAIADGPAYDIAAIFAATLLAAVIARIGPHARRAWTSLLREKPLTRPHSAA